MDINFIDMVLTTLLISIPEQFIMVFIILILLKEYDYLKRENIRNSFIKVGLLIVLPNVLFTTPTFYLDINIYLRLVMNSIMQGFLVYSMVGYWGRKIKVKEHIVNIIKVYGCSVISLGILMFLEVVSFIVPQYIFQYDMVISKTTPITNFIYSIPMNVIMFFIIYINYVNINTPKSLVLDMVWKGTSFFKKIICFQILITTGLCIIIYYNLIKNEILMFVDQDIRTFVVFLIFTIIVMGNFIPWYIIYTLKLKQGKALKKDLS